MEPSPDFLESIIAQHADEACVLALYRRTTLSQAAITLHDLVELDARVEAHLDGLRVAGDNAWNVCVKQIEADEPNALFAAAILALETRNHEGVATLIAKASGDGPARTGLFGGIGWISARYLQGTALSLLAAESTFHRIVGIACCAMHGVDPKNKLEEAIRSRDPGLRAKALRAAGEIGRRDLGASCVAGITDEDADCSFWAAASSGLLGSAKAALDRLRPIALTNGPRRFQAFRLAIQLMGGEAHAFLKNVAADPQQLRWLIHGAGIAGDTAYVPWLIDHLRDDEMARVAGESFSLITGLDLSHHTLARERPENFESGPNDNPEDENVEMDPDEGLPWPDADKVEKWWAANAHRFQKGVRYFMGAPVTREHCINVLKNGYQRQRILAAHYLCLLEPGTPLFNTSAPAWRQQRLLARM